MEILRAIPDISQRMLAKSVRKLEEDGFLSRTVYPTVPPKVEYELTELGQSLMVHITTLVRWAENNHDRIRESRAQIQKQREE